jgi:hypothetical protein
MQHKSILANSKKSKRQYQQQDPESGVLGKDHSDPSDDHHLLRTANETLRIENKNLKRILVALSIVLVLSIGGLVGAAVVVAAGSTSSTSTTTTTTTPENDPEALAPSTSTSIATATATAPPKTTIVYFWPDSDENTTIPSSLYEPSTPVTTTASTNSTSNGNSAGDATPETDKPDLAGEPPSGVEVITASDLFD